MKLRSYNEELLIAAALMTDLFNDVVIERRKHGLQRDYSKAIKIEDILQKNIQVPCVIGDRSAVLKSLQNHEGAIKLPLFVLDSSNIKVDQIRTADLHYDMLYQPDASCQKLPKDNPHYKPYDLRKRRPVPITIQYKLTMITKYKEDLDQMITNWIVHFRPDVYVKWYHPKYRPQGFTIQSQVIGGQSVTYKPPEDSGSKVYQYTADTSFTFKTWLFTGLDYQADQPDDNNIGIIKYFNWFPTDINTTGAQGTEGYPTIGEVGSAPAGFYAVPSNLEFEAPEDATSAAINTGKYFINNITGTPDEVFPDGPRVNIKNVDVDVFTKDTWQQLPKWNIYQDYCACDLISNERFGVKFVYFEGGYPLTAFVNEAGTGPSGDFLFQHFCSSGNKSLRQNIGYFNSQDDQLFGTCYTQSLKVKINYEFNSKTLTLSGITDNDRYICTMYTKMSSLSGIEQGLILYNKPVYNNSIKFNCIRKFDTNYQKINKYFDYTENIEILNSISTQKKGWKDNQTPITFILQTIEEKRKVKELKNCIQKYWNQLEIYPCDCNGNKLDNIENNKYEFYKLTCDNSQYIPELSAYTQNTKQSKFKSDLDTLDKDTLNLDLFLVRNEFTIDDKEYTLIVNKQLYFVLSDDDIYDWGIIVIPRFSYLCAPVFKSTIKNGELIYGIGMNGNLSPVINKNNI